MNRRVAFALLLLTGTPLSADEGEANGDGIVIVRAIPPRAAYREGQSEHPLRADTSPNEQIRSALGSDSPATRWMAERSLTENEYAQVVVGRPFPGTAVSGTAVGWQPTGDAILRRTEMLSTNTSATAARAAAIGGTVANATKSLGAAIAHATTLPPVKLPSPSLPPGPRTTP